MFVNKEATIDDICKLQNKTNHPISSNSRPSASNKATHILKRGGKLQNQREHHIILTEYAEVHPTVVSEHDSSLGMLINIK